MAEILDSKLDRVRKFYYQDLLSARMISVELNVSIDAVYYFMRKHKMKRRGLSEHNAATFFHKPQSFSLKENLSAKEKKLKLLGIVLYWCEGYKAKGGTNVDFANSDPKMIFSFMKFLREICGIEEKKLRILVYCYSNQNPLEIIEFWSKLVKVSPSQFSKPYIKDNYRLDKVGKMPHGLIHIRYGDKKLRDLLIRWIGELKS